MWKIIPNSSYVPEPKELRNLKQLLAKNNCTCEICSSYNYDTPLKTNYHDKQVQVTFNKISSVVSPQESRDTQLLGAKSSLLKEIFCPGCYIALNLFHQKDFKILKDEESESKPAIFTSEKSTEKEISVVEKSTSDTNKPNNAFVLSNEDVSDRSLTTNPETLKVTKENVTFTMDQEEMDKNLPVSGNCHCIANFINSIRPPLMNYNISNIY